MSELPFKEWNIRSPIASVIPLIVQNLMIYFWIFAGEPIALMVFFAIPILYIVAISGVIGYERLKDTWGFDVPSVWHGIALAVLGIVFGIATYQFALLMSTVVGFNLIPVPTATYLSQNVLAYNPILATFWDSAVFNVLYFGVVAFGEELMVLFCMAGIANWLVSKYDYRQGTAILIGATVGRVLWAGTHWGAWLALGMEALGNFAFAIIVGMLFFTLIGYVFRSREVWGEMAFAEFVIIGSLFAHWTYDVIVAMLAVI